VQNVLVNYQYYLENEFVFQRIKKSHYELFFLCIIYVQNAQAIVKLLCNYNVPETCILILPYEIEI